MAGIAHPYEETATAVDAAPAPVMPRERVSFSDLVDTWKVRESSPDAEQRYYDRRADFESARGEITDGYICEDVPMAIVLTAQPPTRWEKLFLFRKERVQLYTETERLVR